MRGESDIRDCVHLGPVMINFSGAQYGIYTKVETHNFKLQQNRTDSIH